MNQDTLPGVGSSVLYCLSGPSAGSQGVPRTLPAPGPAAGGAGATADKRCVRSGELGCAFRRLRDAQRSPGDGLEPAADAAAWAGVSGSGGGAPGGLRPHGNAT